MAPHSVPIAITSLNQSENDFQYDNNTDIEIITVPIFMDDDNGDLMPTIDGTQDNFFEIISDEIVPKI